MNGTHSLDSPKTSSIVLYFLALRSKYMFPNIKRRREGNSQWELQWNSMSPSLGKSLPLEGFFSSPGSALKYLNTKLCSIPFSKRDSPSVVIPGQSALILKGITRVRNFVISHSYEGRDSHKQSLQGIVGLKYFSQLRTHGVVDLYKYIRRLIAQQRT